MYRRSKSLWLALLPLAAAIYLFADAVRPSRGAADGDSAMPAKVAVKRVRVAPVEAARESREVRFSGTTRAARRARLSFSVGGRIVSRPVKVGDQVHAGQLLAELDDLELENALASARATLSELAARRTQSERDHSRTQQLADAKAATSEELERTAAAVDGLRAAEAAAEARLREARRRLAETRLEASFSGTVTEVHFEPGEFARVGLPVVTIAGDGDVEIKVEVPESIVARITVGDETRIRLPVLGGTAVTGRIKSVGRTAAGPGRLFPVVASLEGEDIVVGATAELVLVLKNDRAMTLPVEAVVNPGGRRPSVFRVSGAAASADQRTARIEKRAVEVDALVDGGDGQARVIVRGDLAIGDLVVTGGQRGLLDGEAVMVDTGAAKSRPQASETPR